jgi:hypothetical protein
MFFPDAQVPQDELPKFSWTTENSPFDIPILSVDFPDGTSGVNFIV